MSGSVPTSTRPPIRTYGGWRRPMSPGLGALALVPTLGIFVGLIVTLLVATTTSLTAGAICGAVFLLLTAPAVVQIGDRPAWRHLTLRWAWRRARRTGAAVYRSGPLGHLPEEDCRLPGLLARSRVWSARDSYSRPFALIQHPFSNQWTVVLAVNPNGGALISREDRDGRVAHWDTWLAVLGREHGIDQVAVVLDQVPDPGRILRACVDESIAPDAPEFAARMMRDAARVYPTGSAELTAFVAITFSGRKLAVPTGDRVAEEAAELAAREIGTRLPGLSRSLVATGSGEGRPVTADGLATMVRGWYDPAVQVPLAEAAARGWEPGLRWEDAGPVAAQETWDTYRHDSGLSRVLEMTSSPRGTVYDSVLSPMIAPMPGRKRVTLLYRPLPAADAPAALDLQVRAALNRAGRRKGLVHAHDSAEVRAAVQAAQEEATGAGVVSFSMFVTVTVDGDRDGGRPEEDLRAATEAIVRAARSAQVVLRPVAGAQAAAFAAGLGVGIVPVNHSLLPSGVRSGV
ncbi:MAG: hypothetical protein QG622_603 [Actinomycetota bacterium]|nr:hypothetical protein [Actinomycetota bacterium]